MNAPTNQRQNCPACDHELRRMAPQHGDGEHPTMRRYGCTREGCSWQGLLPRMPPRVKPTLSQAARLEVQRSLARMTRRYWLAAGVALLTLGGLTAALMVWNSEPEVPVLGLTQK